MAHFIGKINLSSLIDVMVADVNIKGEEKKCLVIPIKDNDIVCWRDEWQLWFRAFFHRNPKSKFTHFLMKFIPVKDIKRLSSRQIEAFANHQIGAMKKCGYEGEDNLKDNQDDDDLKDFI